MAKAPCCRDCFHFNDYWNGCEYQPPMSLVAVLREMTGNESPTEYMGFVPNPDQHHCSAFNPVDEGDDLP